MGGTPFLAVGASSAGNVASVEHVLRATIIVSWANMRYIEMTSATMPMLPEKKILLTGLLSNRSIAYGIAKAARREGATLAFTYGGDKLKDRVIDLAKDFDGGIVLPCDVTKDDEIA